MAAGLYDFLDYTPDYRNPPGAIPNPTVRPVQTPPINPIPGTNWPATSYTDFGVNGKDNADAFNAMIYRYSNGISGAPMPAPIPEDPRIAQSRAYSARRIAELNAQGAAGVGSGRNNLVRNVIRGGGFQRATNPAPAPTINPGLTTVIKSPAQQSRLAANLNQFSGPVAQAKANSLTQFTKDYLADRARQKGNYDQESAFIGRTYDPNGLEGDLGRIAKERALLGRQAAESAIRRAGRDSSVARMNAGGVNSSYLDRAYGDVLGRILLENAMRGSDLNRENAMYVQGQRNSALGARARLGADYVEGATTPFRTLTDLQSADLANLGRIGNLEDNYTLYDYVRPDEAARRRLGLLSDLEETKNRFGVL